MTSDVEMLVQAARSAFVDPSGAPVDVRVRPVERESVLRYGPDGPAADAVRAGHGVFSLDQELAAQLLPGTRASGAVAVIGDVDAAVVYAIAPLARHHAQLVEAVRAGGTAWRDVVRQLESEVAVIDALHSVGIRLTAQLELDRLVQDATDAATSATRAEFGAFFYKRMNELGESRMRYTISGVPRARFETFPMPRGTAVFAPTFDGTGTVRSDDMVADPRFGRNPPYNGMPEGHLPVRSYLAVSVKSPKTGEVIGGFFFGHQEPGRFTARDEYLAEGIAAYTAIAMDNARLVERERTFATELAHSMLPPTPHVDGLEIVTRYLPAARGAEVGGDWFDVIPLESGATAFVIGDVVGHGVQAATMMGQVRTAIRSYALLELPPAEVLTHVSRLTGDLVGPSFVTCFYAVWGPGDTLTFANAGHPPALVVEPDTTVTPLGEALAPPLGVGRVFTQRDTLFPPGTQLTLYTDGLIESRSRDIALGTAWLTDLVRELHGASEPGPACDQLIEEMTPHGHDDDIALIHVRRAGASESATGSRPSGTGPPRTPKR
jgi:GAF domain-containing protein